MEGGGIKYFETPPNRLSHALNLVYFTGYTTLRGADLPRQIHMRQDERIELGPNHL
ncbi:16126_t:CDS:2 [Acaulospora colombiana]|uniref:16126_t:CDS:1 n=1 Tax=Acaulospora colombiana TaxID=27376 RepID=A0ACA9M9F3_9GLOM|nr:16126_t:CDS:2 [Acaulospora colombiana]